MDITTLPEDPYMTEELRGKYARLQHVAEFVEDVPESTLKRYLLDGKLAGTKIGPRLWLIQLHTDPQNPDPPGLDQFVPPGNNGH